jgi:hypothetical protein
MACRLIDLKLEPILGRIDKKVICFDRINRNKLRLNTGVNIFLYELFYGYNTFLPKPSRRIKNDGYD